MDSFRGLQTIAQSSSIVSLYSADEAKTSKKVLLRVLIRGYLLFVKGLADALLSLSSVVSALERYRRLIAISGFLGGFTGLFLSYYALFEQEEEQKEKS